MSVFETVDRNQKQALLALHHGNEAVLDVMKPVMSRTEPVWRIMRDLPFVDRLPRSREVVEQWFGFFDGVMKEERDLVLHVVDLLPGPRVTPPVVKAATKAA